MKFPNLVRFGIPALALLLAALFIGPAAGVRAQDGGLAASNSVANQPQVPAAALGTSFTYQGRLADGGNAANGAYDLQFKLFDAASGGTPIGGAVSKNDLAVSGGLFTTDLDFGAGAFDGQARWLEVAVRPGASTGAYTMLAPRRALLASPYATYSNNTRGIAVASGGGVGIGTTSPEYAMDVVGERLRLSQNGNSLTFDASNPGVEIHSSTGKITFWSGAEGFTTLDAGDVQARGNALINGKVGIGTTNPEYKLDVAGRIIRLVENGNSLRFVASNPGVEIASSTGKITFWSTEAGFTELVAGKMDATVLQIRGGADLAEPFAIGGQPQPGLVVAIDPDHVGQLRIADKAYDRTVAGVISGAGGLQPGLTMQQPEVVQGETHPVALTGRVYVWADASFGAIQPGDLLTTSATRGHAMKAGDYALAQGAILGKAMSRLAEGKGLVLVLVSLQ